MHVGYVYTPSLTLERIEGVVAALTAVGGEITHLGKSDPPRKWAGTEKEAAGLIATGTNLTNTSFLRVRNRQLGCTIDQHRDPRWSHDTVSMSGPERALVRDVARRVGQAANAYLVALGETGRGKDQDWDVVSTSDACPIEIRNTFCKAEPRDEGERG